MCYPLRTLTIERLDAASLGALIALFERAVGFYASLIGINAYHQPGVEAGKKAAEAVISLQGWVLGALGSTAVTATALAAQLGSEAQAETVYHLLRHLAANPERGVTRVPGTGPAEDCFSAG